MGYARAILRLNEDAHASVAASRFVGKVRIGASEDLASSWLPRTLRRFKALHPEILLEVDVGIPTNLLTALDEDRLDVVIGSGCRGEGRGWRLWREPLVWAFAEQDRIVSSEPIPLAFFPEPCPYREAAIESLAASQLPWRIAYISPSIAGVRAAALAGLAVTPLPRSSLCSGLVSLQPEEGLPILPDVEYLVAVNEAKSFGAVRALADMIRDRATRQGTV
ncbi:LysR substrate-binding domain-containing protein (plasmid) [Ensifer adhaerens]|uniref:LysR substrate-binding domain-containing protein n=1 Tax=Ensifer adhaerens TaxID=106592 RepID=UPI00210080DB|nr:LysR substrate-binding domain-containing protein [Ensifer adhaerens]UTV41930.1 LysR substrate-binding domain-containing protein [Ensifer adhaerens]